MKINMTRHPLPGRLPPGERILWQGGPAWRALARNALHLRGMALYLSILVGWVAVSALRRGEPLTEAGVDVLRAAAAACVPVGLALLYAWGTSRVTTYTITTHRVLIRMGIALPMTLNLPYAEVETAGLRVRRDGSGDIALRLADQGRKLSWFMLWPHARPMRFGKAEPLLRALADGEQAGAILAEALAKSTGLEGSQQVTLAQTPKVVDSGSRNHGATALTA